MTIPEDSHYAKSHEYVHVEGDIGTIGITEYAQKELGDVVFVELPQVGTQLEQGDEMGSIESVKALADKPERVNTDPYGDGWMIKIRLTDSTEVDDLMNAEDYEDYLQKEAGH
jgi:glycine cleavage system H protein